MLFLPTSLLAAAPQVICVPQVPSDLLVPHDTWSGEPTILKGIAIDDDGNLIGGTYYWEYGDGDESVPQGITKPDNLAATHTYTADPDTLFVARLHVIDAGGESSSDEYRLLIRAKTLDVEINKAIDDGLWWLYTQKEATGLSYYRWNNSHGYNYYANTTASAVHAYEINGYLETGDPDEDPYVNAVRGGIDYLLTTLRTYNMSLQAGGDPDSNGNGIGLAVNSGRSIYETGAVMDAFVASGTLDAIARVGGANVLGRRYQDIVQDMVDVYAWGMYDYRGGWQYSWNSGADNSASQWGAIGMVAAERHFGCTVPQWVKDSNDSWLNYSYNSAGYFGYTGKSAHRSGYATGPSGMVQLSFGGKDVTDSRWQACEVYLENRWDDFIRSNRDCRYYSYYPFAKAMRLALPQEVTHLPSGLDWYGDETRGLARILVDRQNSNGFWPYDGWPYVGERTAAAWNVIILTRTLFEKPPVAIIHAEPNPGAVGQEIDFDASASYHVDPAKEIVEYLWDFDASDGVDFDHPDATDVTASYAYGVLGDYTASLKVIDNSTPERFDISTLTIHITIPPHPPTAVIGGPYLAAVGETFQVDGSGSYDIDENQGDSIVSWEWESDFVAPYQFNEVSGQIATLPAFSTSGRRDIALRVMDNTAIAFPTAGTPDLTDVAYGEVIIYKIGVTDLYARPKATKCQLVWTHIGLPLYEVLRSESGPNQGFELIGTTDSTYSTYLDYNVVMYKDYWYRIRCELDGDTVLSAPMYVYSQGRIRNRPPRITSLPLTEAREATPYVYDVDAVDPERQAITYILDLAPDGMEIDPATGLITWTPALEQIGLQNVMVRAQDARRASTTQFFQIVVSPRHNTAPVVNPGGPYSDLINQAITFSGSATDPEGDPIADYHWVFGDGNDAHGQQVNHAYTASTAYVVTLYVTDTRGGTGYAETVCQIGVPNRTPIADADGPYSGEVDTEIHFDGSQSYDPDGDPLAYTWNFGDSTSPATGVQVSHKYAQTGTYNVSLQVDDGRGGLDTADIQVTITPQNQPPVAGFTFDGDLVMWATLTFDGTGSYDAEGRPLASWEWDFGDGSSTTGAIVTHGYAEPGDYTVILTVTDDKGAPGTAEQVLSIAHPPNHDPVIATGGPYQGPINTAITFTATGADPDGDELTYTWGYGGETYSGQSVELTFDATGTYEVQLSADDGYGGTAQDVASVMVYDPDAPVDHVPPEVALTSPSSGDTLSGVVDIEGSVTDDNLASWVLEYAPAGSDDWVEISSGTNPVTDGLLGQIDVGLMSDDFYRFRLTANDYNQSSSTWIECKVNDPVKLGRFSITYEDLSLPAMGMTLNIRRTYDSTRKAKGDFGIGWTLDMKTAEIREDASHNVFVTLPDGRRVAFAFTPVQMSPWFPFYEARFTAPPGVFDELDFVGNHMVVFSGGDWYFFLDSAGKFDPDTYILTTKQGITYTIGQDLGVTRIEDRNSNYLEIKENGIISSCGRNVVFTRDGEGRIVSIVDPIGNQLTYTYDANGDLIQYEDQDNNTIKYSYINDHYLLDIEDPNGNKPIRNEYYPDGRLSVHEGSAGNRTTYTYDVANNTETVTNPRGHSTTYRYNEMGKVLEVTDPLGTSTLYTYDGDGNELSVTNPSGRVVTYSYDAKGNRLNETHEPEPGKFLTSVSTYDAYGQVTRFTKPMGDKTVYTYDSDGNLLSREMFDSADNLVAAETYSYDADGKLSSRTDPEGRTTAFSYNSFGDIVAETSPTGEVTAFEYDSNGNRTALVDALGNRSEFVFNGLNKMTQMSHGGHVRYSITYNHSGKMLTLTDARGAVTAFEYDPMGNLVGVIDANGNITNYQYDETSSMAVVTDANGNNSVYQYDMANRMTCRTGPHGGAWGFGYTPDGYLNRFTTPNTAVVTQEHDGMNRVVRRVESETIIEYEYDDNNRLVAVNEDAAGPGLVTTYTYDVLGRVVSTTDPHGRAISYGRNALGERTTMTTPDGLLTTYDYDSAGRVQETMTGSDWVKFSYDTAGQRVRTDCSNGASTIYAYDSLGRLTNVLIKDGDDNLIAVYDYTLDENGQRTGATLADGAVSYTLDSLYRLTREEVSSTIMGTFIKDYAYDGVGNRLDPGASFGSDNRLLGDGINIYGYDINGNIISRGQETFTYDSANRLIGYSDGTTTASYKFDYLGRRVTRTVNGDVKEYQYDGQNIVAEYLNGTQIARYTHGMGMDEPFMVISDGQTYFYHRDGLGSVIAITDSTGQVVRRYGYDAWGNIIYADGSGPVNSLTFTGREYDEESGLYHFRARAYDPRLGRFLQKDPQQGRLLLPQTQHRYSYALNNPVNFVDPTGELAVLEFALICSMPNGREVAAALAGFLQGFGTTNIVFLGEFLGLVANYNTYDVAHLYDVALLLTSIRMDKVKDALGIAESAGDELAKGLLGIPGAFNSGVTFKVGFEISVIGQSDGVSIEASGGGFANGVKQALKYIGQLRPR